MDKLDQFIKELDVLCNKYGLLLTGKTTNSSIHVRETNKTITSSVLRNSKHMGFIACKED